MAVLLAADLGGTHARLRLSRVENAAQETLAEHVYSAAEYPTFYAVLAEFCQPDVAIDLASLAVAGPVTEQQVQLTNLPWHIDAAQLKARFPIARALLINDFAALAYAIDSMHDSAHVRLQAGVPKKDAVAAVIGAGTGLGHGFWRGSGKDINVFSTEAAHAGFAPRGPVQLELWQFLTERFGRAMYEHILSGPGLVNLFDFFAQRTAGTVTPELSVAMRNGEPAAAISTFALSERDPVAQHALELFVDIYAARAADFALTVLAHRGVYIAGGIAAKILPALQRPQFLATFNDNPAYRGLLEAMPVLVVTDPLAGLYGAQAAGIKMLRDSGITATA